jgi:hypothetical protein
MAIRIPIISDFDDKGLARATRQFKDLETTGQKAQFAIKKAALPAALALGGLAVAAGDAFKAFAEDSAAADKLALSLKNSTGATDAQVASVEDFISATSKAAAVADDDLRPALDNLVRGTKDITKSQELLSLALDISAGTGKDLESVTAALSKAYNGQLGPLKKLDPALASLIKSGASADDVFKALGNTFGGQAAAQANTAEGRMKNLSIQMGELKESVGAAVAPIIEALLPAFQNITSWISENTGLVVGLGVAIGGIALAVWGANAALTAWNVITKVTAALNAILGTSFSALWVATGVGIIVAIIAAVVALQAKFKLFTPVIDGLKAGFQAVWSVASQVFQWIWDRIQMVAGALSGAFRIAFGLITGYFNTWWSLVSGIATKVGEIFTTLATAITGTIKGILQTFIGAFVKALNGLISLINKAIRGFNKIPLVPNLPTIPELKVPQLANGGIVTGPTLAMIGEAGPEAVIPLDRLNQGITVNVAGSVTSERDLIETIRRGLVNSQRNGAQLVYSNT